MADDASVAEEVARLYGLAPEAFVAERNAAAKAWKKASRSEDAATLAASFAQKLWRFCANPYVKGTAMIGPMHALIRREVAEHPGVHLAVHDWSTLGFAGHDSKKDRATPTHPI